jgi:hypothetical protein
MVLGMHDDKSWGVINILTPSMLRTIYLVCVGMHLSLLLPVSLGFDRVSEEEPLLPSLDCSEHYRQLQPIGLLCSPKPYLSLPFYKSSNIPSYL